MTTCLKLNQTVECPVEQEIRSHSAWLGRISGIKAEKMLAAQKAPYLYVLREGENVGDYYVSFVQPCGSVFHQPFSIFETVTGWYYQQGGGGPIAPDAQLDDILYLIMHCKKGECRPLEI